MVATTKTTKTRSKSKPRAINTARPLTPPKDIEQWYPNVECWPTPNRCDDTWSDLPWCRFAGGILAPEQAISSNDKKDENDYCIELKNMLENHVETYSFTDMMAELGIPLDIFNEDDSFMVDVGTHFTNYTPHKEGDGDCAYGGMGKDKDGKQLWWHSRMDILRFPCKTITYVRPVLKKIDIVDDIEVDSEDFNRLVEEGKFRNVERDGKKSQVIEKQLPLNYGFRAVVFGHDKEGKSVTWIDCREPIIVHAKDLDYRTFSIPVDENGNLNFPLLLHYSLSAKWMDAKYTHWSCIVKTPDEFREMVIRDLTHEHEQGYRVAFFEQYEAECGLYTDDVCEHVLWADDPNISDRGKAWLDKHGFTPEPQCSDCKYHDACKLIEQQANCPLWIEKMDAWNADLDATLLSKQSEAAYVKMVNTMNRFRVKGTYFTTMYTINFHAFPHGWSDSWEDNDDFTRKAVEDPDDAELKQRFPHYLAYFLSNMKSMKFEFTDEDAFNGMMLDNSKKWEPLIKVYQDNVKQGKAQDVIAKEKGLTQMAISKQVSQVRGEISRRMGKAYEIHIERAQKLIGTWKDVQGNGDESMPDLWRWCLDGSIEVVSVKCYNVPRPELSVNTDESDPKCEITPELTEVRNRRANSEQAKLILHFYNHATKYIEERELDPDNLRPSETFKQH